MNEQTTNQQPISLKGNRQELKKQFNLEVLRRKDSDLKDILNTFGHVVVYKYSNNSWERIKVEGSMFVISRCKKPLYRFVVMNRLSTKNYFQDVVPGGLEIQLNIPYVIYKNTKTGVVHGLWFYNSVEALNFYLSIERFFFLYNLLMF